MFCYCRRYLLLSKRYVKARLQQRNSTQLDVELSWVELCRYERAFRHTV